MKLNMEGEAELHLKTDGKAELQMNTNWWAELQIPLSLGKLGIGEAELQPTVGSSAELNSA